MNRREFLAAGASVGAVAGTGLMSRFAWAADVPKDLKITRAVSFELEYTRPKHVGKNSYRHDHGPKAYDRIVRLYTNTGIDGFGTCWSGANECGALLGKNPMDFVNLEARKATGPLGRYSSPLWDLIGKAVGQPVWKLLGGAGPAQVPVYDGSIYFTDLRPPFLSNWRDEFKREFDASMANGHRAFKIKIGRGKLWMLVEDGYRRDLEVVRLIREHVGPDVLMMVDANDGYDFERTKRFVRDTADLKLVFIEEMMPDNVEQYLAVKEVIRELGLQTLIADGENRRLPSEMKAWADAKAVDVYQGDMNLFGFEDIMAEAEMVRPFGGTVAPHNWGSLMGYYLQLQVGRAISNFFRAEQDPMSCPAIIAEGFAIKNGVSTVPDVPGLGLEIDDGALPDGACLHFDLRA